MARLFWLSDEAWAAVKPHLPRGRPGKPRGDDRRVIGGILHVLKTGCRWRDVPAAYGPPTTHAASVPRRSIAWPMITAYRSPSPGPEPPRRTRADRRRHRVNLNEAAI